MFGQFCSDAGHYWQCVRNFTGGAQVEKTSNFVGPWEWGQRGPFPLLVIKMYCPQYCGYQWARLCDTILVLPQSLALWTFAMNYDLCCEI